ncbi:HK97 gp10 family phage protein [Neobacillus sp. MM2021_6]|uniref:HK97 gp10 family phage protein n=1 Tax=Bacillaceae TaxID=186817 RepID=UPI00140DF620|nr:MULTISPECIES: HK97 gp10 family phage protein [Bacillaceae]MBO0962343.1 HK97 gp10 family phage protein [Neobacillus sp. MM2021_6]NHC20826.1 HK97 gp10 family phage protein [Bacillus sp. MM2020_4]
MADGVKVQMKIDAKAMSYFKSKLPHKLQEARKKAVEAAGMVWADEAKEITTQDDHIDTGLYVNSIGYVTGSPATSSDVINDVSDRGSKTTLKIGSNVAYAGHLEKHFNIMGRALDSSEKRIKKVGQEQIKRTLFGG